MKLTATLVAGIAAVTVALRTKLQLSKVNVNKYPFGDPTGGCQPGELNVTVEGVSGDFCSPACDASGGCPAWDPSLPPSTQGQCVLVAGGGTNPTLCALLCTPGTANACGTNGTCQPIEGLGLCTFPWNM